MSFQAYLDTIMAKTGKTPEDFKEEIFGSGALDANMKASELVAYLKQFHNLGHGHSMAIWAVFKTKGWVTAK